MSYGELSLGGCPGKFILLKLHSARSSHSQISGTLTYNTDGTQLEENDRIYGDW